MFLIGTTENPKKSLPCGNINGAGTRFPSSIVSLVAMRTLLFSKKDQIGKLARYQYTNSVRIILLLASTSSILRALLPLPLVFRPLSVCPLPLKDSNSEAPEEWTTAVFGAVPRAPLLSDEPGRDVTVVAELRSILSFDAIVSGGAGSGRFGST